MFIQIKYNTLILISIEAYQNENQCIYIYTRIPMDTSVDHSLKILYYLEDLLH